VAAMADWQLYTGSGKARKGVAFPDAPPWRRFDGQAGAAAPFRATPELIEAVNAALLLRRPLLLTGRPGSGKSSLIDSVARELKLGQVLRWHVTSRSTLEDALYRYDAIGRLHQHTLAGGEAPSVGRYLRLGPLGTALLPRNRPRALLIDEIDKSDIDLPNDLLNVFERGEFEIPELARLDEVTVDIREDGSDDVARIMHGKVRTREFPFVVLTSNGERDFPTAFLRRCIRFRMPDPGAGMLAEIVAAHLGDDVAADVSELIRQFAVRVKQSRAYATDQLMNAAYVVMRDPTQDWSAERSADDPIPRVVELLLKELNTDVR